MSPNNAKESAVHSISKTLSILSTFTDTCPRQRVSDIAEKLDLNISTVSRHLSTMLDAGFLERDDETGCYSLGLKIACLAGIALHNSDVYRHSFPELHQLSQKTGLHCFMGVQDGDDISLLISVGGEETIELMTPIGYHHPMYCSAIGRAILSQMPFDEAEKILARGTQRKYASNTKTDKQAIIKELSTAREKGYAIIVDELTPGKASISAPIFSRNRKVIAAISMSANISTMNLEENEDRLAKQLLHSAGKISGKLGYFPGNQYQNV